MKFALELFVPEKRMPAGGNSAPEIQASPQPEASPAAEVSPQTVPEAAPHAATAPEIEPVSPRQRARRMIEELDHGRFGGPSFSQQTIELMSFALERAEASLGAPASDEQLRSTAAVLLQVAGDGERDPVRLRVAAISALAPVASTADQQPPST